MEEFRNGAWVLANKSGGLVDPFLSDFSYRPVMVRAAKLRITLLGNYSHVYSQVYVHYSPHPLSALPVWLPKEMEGNRIMYLGII
jgi:hypothetical protein